MADKTTGLKIKVDLDADDAKKEGAALDSTIKDLSQSTTELNKDLGATETAAEAAAKELGDLGDTAGDTAKDFKTLSGGQRTIADIRAEMDKARSAFDRFSKSGKADLEEVDRAAKLLDKRLEDLERKIKDVGDAADDVDAGGINDLLSSVATATAAAVSLQQAIAAVGEYAGFQDDLLAVKTLAGATSDEMVRLKTAAFDLAGAAGGPAAIASAMSELAASGSDVNEIISNVDIVGKLKGASRGVLEFKESGDLLTNTVKQLRLDMDSSAKVADRLAKGSNTAGHDMAELGAALTQVLPVATELYGHLGDTVPLEKSIAVINVLAETYKKGSEGGNAYLMMIRALAKPVGEGAAALDKYKDTIKVFDDTGKMINFADIITSIGKAQLSTTDQLAIFGEAWPAVTALIGAGGDAIRKAEEQIRSADGTVGATSKTLQEGLGGSLREATAELEKARLTAVEDFLPALQWVASGAEFADNAVSGLSATIKLLAAGATQLVAIFLEVGRYGESLSDLLTGDNFNEWGAAADAAWASARDLGDQSVAASKKANGEIDILAESTDYLNDRTQALGGVFKEISKATGITVTSMQEVDAAVAAGTIRQDEATGAWTGAEKEKQDAIDATARAAVEASDKIQKNEKKTRSAANKQWKDFAKEVKKILDDIADRESDLTAELAEMARSGMTVAEAHKAIKKEADSALTSAQALREAGDLEGALKSTDAAADAYKDYAGNVQSAASELEKSKENLKKTLQDYKELKKEAKSDGIVSDDEKKKIKEARKEIKELKKAVSENKEALIDEKKALETAMQGVEKAGRLAIEIQKEAAAKAETAGNAIDEAYNFSGLNESAQKAADTAGEIGPALADGVKDGVDAAVVDAKRLEDALDAAAKDRTASFTITERTVQAAFHGALIRGPNMSGGGQVSGPTGYDSVLTALSGEESVTQSKRVRELGYNRVMRPINDGNYDKAIKGIAAYLGPIATRDALASYLMPQAMDMAMVAPPEMPRLSPGQGAGSAQPNFPHLVTIIVDDRPNGSKFSMYTEPKTVPQVAAWMNDPDLIKHGKGGR